ncbi:hypothetical protein [Amycolatopsis sp. DG1A-15b]|uniref:hypothetical protein n=1 Tax=Amycolatopsis sp. DG1A-15b TaxID=3052846 RepID=UPI00255B9BFE|nr:hypothetical protein [Amycolatopsis sp. DG1A-15b]WIX89987.1 hypothetical protein QRY02_05945 [Amycolatopsis sp. DG1A-15b]
MTEDPAQRIRDAFSDAEREELDRCRHRINDEKSIGVLELLVSWALHVRKIDEDRAKPVTDRHVWGAHDLLAAVSVRSFLARCLERLAEPLNGKVAGQIAHHDEHFVSITRVDADELRGYA